RIVKWCPRDQSAISDLEVQYVEEDGHLYYLDYPVEGGGTIPVATARPETMVGDTGVAVHPDDWRYKDLIGKHVVLPIVHRRVPIVADEAGDLRFHPERWREQYLRWMRNIRDWNISRQLWLGHRIPVWTCANGHAVAYLKDPQQCEQCGDRHLTQDPDVLDTWFSSSLWP